MSLIALSPIIYKNKRYKRGEMLPEGTEMQELWIECGSAAFEEIGMKERKPKARIAAATPGLPGTAVNSESEINLVGRVPDTERRRRK